MATENVIEGVCTINPKDVERPASGVQLYFPDDQRRYLPQQLQAAPVMLPDNAHLPRQGDLIYLSSTSAWGVSVVIHEWLPACAPRVQVWLEHVGGSHAAPLTDAAPLMQ